ncbi:MAG: hypothetical protein ACT452_16025 [Microthrixaceae bacterium]
MEVLVFVVGAQAMLWGLGDLLASYVLHGGNAAAPFQWPTSTERADAGDPQQLADAGPRATREVRSRR